MTTTFLDYKVCANTSQLGDCIVCTDSLHDGTVVVGHLAGTSLDHFIHQTCLKSWLINGISKNCPVCRGEIDTSTFFSLKDRFLSEVNAINGSEMDAGVGAFLAGCFKTSIAAGILLNTLVVNGPVSAIYGLLPAIIGIARGVFVSSITAGFGAAVGSILGGLIGKSAESRETGKNIGILIGTTVGVIGETFFQVQKVALLILAITFVGLAIIAVDEIRRKITYVNP